MNGPANNVDAAELARFGKLAARWWDPDGDSRALHDLDPVRLGYIAERTPLGGAEVLDVGCGGGILSESLARAGAKVTAIDLAPAVLEVARMHLHESGLQVDYREIAVEELATQAPARFDVITCMEMLEHVPDPASVIDACATLLKPGGRMFVSTLNRTPIAFAGAIVMAEHLLHLLPRGTHQYAKFIRPSELARTLRAAGCMLEDLRGIAYNPLSRKAWLGGNVSINYIACAAKRA
jgi:2-polyprenyl-6-hydroxyphenyl methylase/3-demethylubiquinone-9 3-methyltransferase